MSKATRTWIGAMGLGLVALVACAAPSQAAVARAESGRAALVHFTDYEWRDTGETRTERWLERTVQTQPRPAERRETRKPASKPGLQGAIVRGILGK